MFFFCLKKYIEGVFIKTSLLQAFRIEYYWYLVFPNLTKSRETQKPFVLMQSVAFLFHLPLHANIRYNGHEMYFETSFFEGIYNVVKINPVVCDQWQTPPSYDISIIKFIFPNNNFILT